MTAQDPVAPKKPTHPLDGIRERCPAKDRKGLDAGFRIFCIVTASFTILILGVLLVSIFWQGLSSINWNFLTHYPEPDPAEAGIGPALWGTVWLCVTCGVIALPIGVATAIFLEEFKPISRPLRFFHSFIQLNINNLAGVPSVVYGILGLTLFANMAGWFGSTNEPNFEFGVSHYDQFYTAGDRALLVPVEADAPPTVAAAGMKALAKNQQTQKLEWVTANVVKSRRDIPRDAEARTFAVVEGKEAGRINRPSWYYVRLPIGRGVLAGALTLMLVILPIVIISSQEAIRGVPNSLREAGLGLGSTRWQVVWNITLPAAIPGIMTGAILAMSRAIGEAAPILIIAGVVFITSSPSNLMDSFTVLPLQIYNWTGRPQHEFQELAAGGIIVLLCILFVFNAAAVLIRQLTQKRLS